MRIGFARVFQKSNSFAKTITEFDDFKKLEFSLGDEIVELYTGTGTFLGGLIEATTESEFELAPIASLSAPSGGPVSCECLASINDVISQELQSNVTGIDALAVELSGAMSTEAGESADEHLISNIRGIAPELPLVLVLSAQANVTPGLVEACDWVVGPNEIPETAPRNLSRHVASTLSRLTNDIAKNTTVQLHQLPILIPIAAQRSGQQPIDEIHATIAQADTGDCNAVMSFFCGYPYADAEFAGASIVSCSFGEGPNIEAVADSLRSLIWERRSEFYVQGSNVEEAVHHAMASREGPVLIVDLGDNPDDGAPGDGTTVLWALLDLGVRNATIGSIADEQAVEACVRAGIDARVEIPVGGRRDTRHGYPIDIQGKVVSIHHGTIRRTGSVQNEVALDPGTVVVLDVEARHEGHVELILTERPIQITDDGLFRHAGIDLGERAIVSIKSTVDYRPAFERIASEIFEVITPGITTPDPAFYDYQRVRRPIYPLDPI